MDTGAAPYFKYLEFSTLCLASAILWWQPLRSTLHLALSSDSYTHILLILPVCFALSFAERRQSLNGSLDRWVGWAPLLLGVLVRAVVLGGHFHLSTSDTLAITIFALVLWWIGSVIVCFGFSAARSHLFTLCFLFLFVPLPDEAVNWIVDMLQNTSAAASSALFRMAQVPVTRQGILLSIPGLDIEVARECSSIRSSTMLVVLTLVLAHLFLRSGWRQTLLVLAAIPLSIAKNAVRIFTIAQLATRVDPSYLDGRLHHQGGVVFLALAALVTILLLCILRKGELPDRGTG